MVSHDAGGAEVLSSYISKTNLECMYVLSGPAISIFERKFGTLKLHPLEEAVGACSKLFCGTSWQSDLEWSAIGLANASKKFSIAFLDHWGRYRERFIRNQTENIPSEIWVGDEYAEKIAKEIFTKVCIRLIPNAYFDDIRHEFINIVRSKKGGVTRSKGLNILFVCEPLSEHGLLEYGNSMHWGYTEHDALRYFMENIGRVFGSGPIRVVVRPHPSETIEKYRWVESDYPSIAFLDNNKLLIDQIADADIIVGCESMAMVVGLIGGKRVISCIPSGGSPCGLPQIEIEDFTFLLNKVGAR